MCAPLHFQVVVSTLSLSKSASSGISTNMSGMFYLNFLGFFSHFFFAVEKLTFAAEKLTFAVEKLTFAVEKLTFAVEKLLPWRN